MAEKNTEGSVSGGESLEDSDVLAQYLSLFQAEDKQFLLHFASNGVVDWFGRSVCGQRKVHAFLRYEVSTKYEHVDFEKVQSCRPIEYKPTHIKTKDCPSVGFILPKYRIPYAMLWRKRTGSDMDDDDHEVRTILSCEKTPEKQKNAPLELGSTTPSTSLLSNTLAHCTSSSESDSCAPDERNGIPSKRRKHSRAPTTSSSSYLYLQRHSKSRLIHEAGIRPLCDSSTDDEEEVPMVATKASAEYTSLKYFETTGLLRSQPQSMLSDFTGLPVTSAKAFDCPTRIRISYRRYLSTPEIEFVLVLYEQADKSLSVPSRRNLFLEFGKTINSPDKNAEEEASGDNQSDGQQQQQQQQVQGEEHEHDVQSISERTFLAESESPECEDTSVLSTPIKVARTTLTKPKRKDRTLSQQRYRSGSDGYAAKPSQKRKAARSLRL